MCVNEPLRKGAPFVMIPPQLLRGLPRLPPGRATLARAPGAACCPIGVCGCKETPL